MKVGFTGTREGMTDAQQAAFEIWIDKAPRFVEFHHGCCLGADAQAVHVISACGEAEERPKIVGHPGDWGPLTDKQACAVSAVMHPCRPMLERNRHIVDATDILMACPRGPEELRSGTWMTIRYARRQRKPVVIFWPDGTVTKESFG